VKNPVLNEQRSFHLDHAAALTYIMEKVCFYLLLGRFFPINGFLDKFSRRKGKGVHDTSNESSTQVHDARLCSHEVRYDYSSFSPY
jgi:hypothetical protein